MIEIEKPKPPLPRLVLPVLLGLVAWAWGAAALFPPMNHDVAAIYHWAERMVAGEALYSDLIDVNPPMVFWLSTGPAWLAQAFHLNGQVAYISVILGLIALISLLALSAASQGRHRDLEALTPDQPPYIHPALRWMILVWVLLALPQHSFAQREHLFLALAVPWLVLAERRWSGGAPADFRLRLLSVLLLVLGMGMKPHFALPVLLVEGVLLIRHWQLIDELAFDRRLNPGRRKGLTAAEPWLIALVGLIYLGAAWLFARPYFTDILPLALPLYAGEAHFTPLVLLTMAPGLWSLGFIIAAAFACWRLDRSDLLVWPIFAVAALVGAVLQGKGYDYHYLAAQGAALIGLGLVVLPRLAEPLTSSWPQRGAAAGLILLVLTVNGSILAPFLPQRAFADSSAGRMAELIRREAQGKPVMWLSTSIHPHFSVLREAGSPLALSYQSLWMLPALFGDGARGKDPALLKRAEAALMSRVTMDLAYWEPRLVVVTDGQFEPGLGNPFWDHLAFFSRSRDFASRIAKYHEIARIDGWRILKRDD